MIVMPANPQTHNGAPVHVVVSHLQPDIQRMIRAGLAAAVRDRGGVPLSRESRRALATSLAQRYTMRQLVADRLRIVARELADAQQRVDALTRDAANLRGWLEREGTAANTRSTPVEKFGVA